MPVEEKLSPGFELDKTYSVVKLPKSLKNLSLQVTQVKKLRFR
jgi:hypothetical protein